MNWRMLTAVAAAVLLIAGHSGFTQEEKKEPKQEVKAANSESISLSGRVQFQHLYTDQFESDGTVTNYGFRLRRVRLRTDAKLTSFVSARVEFDVRDNSPVLKDAFGRIKLFEDYYFRGGQFKIPIWREEFIRSSGELLLVERSPIADFLILMLLSARQVGAELGGDVSKQLSFAINYNNGAGEGIHELARRKESTLTVNGVRVNNVNNGKMLVGRVNFNPSKQFQLGLSAAVNYIGNEIASFDSLGNKTVKNTRGQNRVIAPDFGVYLPMGLDLEGGVVVGVITKNYLNTKDDVDFTGFDVTGRWKIRLKNPGASLGGLDGLEFAAGVSYLDTDFDIFAEQLTVRLGPAFYFGKKTRLQINGEYVEPSNKNADNMLRMRSQITVNL